MRIIKFRGLTDEHVWVYGWFTDDDLSPDIIDAMSTRHKVLSKTVGQYTGLTDSTGKEIYEGDVLECLAIDDGPFTVRVVFRNGAFHTDVHDGVNGADFTCLLVDIFALGDVRIVGNIWDGYPKFVSIAGMGGFEK